MHNHCHLSGGVNNPTRVTKITRHDHRHDPGVKIANLALVIPRPALLATGEDFRQTTTA